jgi:hypothetical protein
MNLNCALRRACRPDRALARGTMSDCGEGDRAEDLLGVFRGAHQLVQYANDGDHRPFCRRRGHLGVNPLRAEALLTLKRRLLAPPAATSCSSKPSSTTSCSVITSSALTRRSL